MKSSEIVVGGTYFANVSGKRVRVRVDSIENRPGYKRGSLNLKSGTNYNITNLNTGRTTVFRSAQRFLGAAPDPSGKPGKVVKGKTSVGARPKADDSSSAPNTPPVAPTPPGYFGDGPDSGDPLRPAATQEGGSNAHDREEWVRLKNEFGRREAEQEAAAHMAGMELEEKETTDFIIEAASTAITPAEVGEVSHPERTADRLRLEEREARERKATPTGIAAKLKALREDSKAGPPHVVVVARAGTGKTTTLVGGLQALKGIQPTTTKHTEAGPVQVPIIPSPQQKAVWDAILQSKGEARTVCFAAFNWTIAQELKGRVPPGCEAMTMHSMGYRAINKSIGYCRVDDKGARVPNFICEILGCDIWDLRKKDPVVLEATTDLVRLCKLNLVGLDRLHSGDDNLSPEAWAEDLDLLVSHYDVDLNGSKDRVYSLVPQVLARCLNVARDKTVDFNDQVWLPVALRLPVFRYDLLLVDEAQDLNRAQQELAWMAGKRLVFCGDDRQAIYGFAGADSQSLSRVTDRLGATDRGVIVLPLTVTRRCGKAIVEEARRIVPDFEAHEDNSEGQILSARYDESSPAPTGEEAKTGMYHEMAKEGDFVLCRVNAPLVSQCFRFLKKGIKATIQGRDVGKGLTSLVKRLKADSVTDLVWKLDDWMQKEVAKEQAKRFPSENRVIAIQDRADCLMTFCENVSTVAEVLDHIDRIFTANKDAPGIRLSSIHKCKGLEARRVFFLRPKGAGCPHPMARSEWEIASEYNLLYVAITRAVEVLVYVS